MASGKAKEKAKNCPLVHAPNMCMSVMQCKVRFQVDNPSLWTNEFVHPALLPGCSE